ncbi:MAG: ABC transporter ATP-binding protein [Betaproteobacteria bacterium]|nr:MAG: ABC transporter ATP-binding protein [Betaproteobacteria bacterium]
MSAATVAVAERPVAQPFLSVRGVSKRFGGLTAVDNVTFDVTPGEIVSIIGPNGAGKTTLFNLLTGQLKPTAGDVNFNGEVINAVPPDRRAEVGLGHRAAVRASQLTLSECRRLEVARALALEPSVILLDEVMAGLNQSEVSDSIALFQKLNGSGLTFLIIEHNLKVVRTFSERVIVLDRGSTIAEGNAETILTTPEVVTAYLGNRRR